MDYNRIRTIERSLKVANRNFKMIGRDMGHIFKSLDDFKGFANSTTKWIKWANSSIKDLWTCVCLLGIVDGALAASLYIQDGQISKLKKDNKILRDKQDIQKILLDLALKEIKDEGTEDEECLRVSKPETDDGGHEAG